MKFTFIQHPLCRMIRGFQQRPSHLTPAHYNRKEGVKCVQVIRYAPITRRSEEPNTPYLVSGFARHSNALRTATSRVGEMVPLGLDKGTELGYTCRGNSGEGQSCVALHVCPRVTARRATPAKNRAKTFLSVSLAHHREMQHRRADINPFPPSPHPVVYSSGHNQRPPRTNYGHHLFRHHPSCTSAILITTPFAHAMPACTQNLPM